MSQNKIKVIIYDPDIDYIYTKYKNTKRYYVRDIRRKKTLLKIEVEE